MILEETVSRIPDLDREAMEAAEMRQSHLTKPIGALGRLEELSVRLAGVAGSERPRFPNRTLVVVAAARTPDEMATFGEAGVDEENDAG